jgi:hypothetical protein
MSDKFNLKLYEIQVDNYLKIQVEKMMNVILSFF